MHSIAKLLIIAHCIERKISAACSSRSQNNGKRLGTHRFQRAGIKYKSPGTLLDDSPRPHAGSDAYPGAFLRSLHIAARRSETTKSVWRCTATFPGCGEFNDDLF